MKIIALLPVKNEGWILRTCLSSLAGIADEIIALNDDSSDETAAILAEFKARSYSPADMQVPEKAHVDMSAKRNFLLAKGREHGGTHFVWLDADEAFSSNFKSLARNAISALEPGQKMHLAWITLWKTPTEYRTDGVWNTIFKDFVFCDDGSARFDVKFLSESRTPTAAKPADPVIIPISQGAVLHYQFVSWMKTQWKQAWYRCNEKIEGSRSARRINATYSITLDSSTISTTHVPEKWHETLPAPIQERPENYAWYADAIRQFFNQHGIEMFEGLQIWHIPELRQQFVDRMHREPKSQVFPPVLMKLNALRHAVLKRMR